MKVETVEEARLLFHIFNSKSLSEQLSDDFNGDEDSMATEIDDDCFEVLADELDKQNVNIYA